MAVYDLAVRRQFERRFFLLVAVLFPLVILAGFGRTYYLKGLFSSPPVPSTLVHVHAFLMTAWVALFMTQVWLISSRRVTIHRQLGIVGAVLGALLIPVGVLTAIAAAKHGSASAPPTIPPLQFMVVPLADILMFAIFFGGALYYRKRAAEHKRLILLTILNFLPPAIARLSIAIVATASPLAFFGIPDLLAIVCLAFDTWKNGKVNAVFLTGIVLFIASQPLRIMLSGTVTWLRFATWLTT
jgi:hypothetical protein